LELLVKERLTGAIILVVLIVLLVPELLSGPKHPVTQTPAAAASSAEEVPLRSYTINLADDAHPRGTSGTPSNGPAMPQPSGPEQPSAAQSGAPADSSVSGSAGSEAQNDSSAQQPGDSSGSGAVAQNSPAQSSQAQTAPATPAQTAPTPQAPPQPPATRTTPKHETPKQTHVAAAADKPASKPHTPVPTQVAANKASAPPEKASAPEGSGWYVQLGVFKVRENADRLASEVRGKGFKASVAPVSASHKLFRVRVGPAADRAAAQELQGRLRDHYCRPSCAVVPYS
jgi:cell division septation protein DedD